MDKVKLSEIRAQFPMYADIPDAQLLGALHQKFYSNIPRETFLANIDYDTNRPDPTAGMSGLEKFGAGAGKAFVDLARGAGQLVGAVSRDDIKQARKLDKPLMDTGAGTVGNVAGNVAALLPTAFIPGANTLAGAGAIGAATGLVSPSESTSETLKNTAIGGVLGPASVLAGRAVAAGARGLQGLVDPFTQRGQERVAAATLKQFATNPDKAATALRSAQELVPGSAPTMAQAADDMGLAQLERTLANNPEIGGRLAEHYAAQRGARLGAIADIAGDPAKREAAVAARQAAAGPLYEQATKAAYAVDSDLANILSRPIGKQALARAKQIAENQGRPFQFSTESSGAFAGAGVPAQQTARITGQGLQDIKMALDDMLSNPMSGIAKSEAAAVKNIRGQLIGWMENQNEAFKAARTTFADKSTPINTMDVAQALMDKLQPALARYGATTKEHAAAYAKALEAAKDTVKKQTGIDKPIEDVIDAKALQVLESVAKDMGRKVKAEDMGRAIGSNTAQNLAAQNLLRRILGPTGLPQSWSENTALHTLFAPYTGVAKLAGAEQRVMDRLADAAIDPQYAAGLLSAASAPNRMGLLGRQIEPALPALSGAGLLSYQAR